MGRIPAFVGLCLVMLMPGPVQGQQSGLSDAPTRSEVSLSGDGVQLGGVLYRPAASEPASPALIVLHGWASPGVNGSRRVEGTARRLAEQGYVSLALSMRGWPTSEGEDDCGLKQPDDVVLAADWLAKQPGVDERRIGVLGYSQGGQVALLSGARTSRIKAVVAFYPVTETTKWQQTTSNDGIQNRYVPKVCGFGKLRSPFFAAASMNAPVLLIHGDRDTRVPTEQSVMMHEALQKAGRTSELHLIPGAVHGFNSMQQEQAWSIVTRFLSTYLVGTR